MTIRYQQGFVGLNTMIYEPCGWDLNEQTSSTYSDARTPGREVLTWINSNGRIVWLAQNHIGSFEFSPTMQHFGYSVPAKINANINYMFRFQFPVPSHWASMASYGTPKNSIGGAVFNGLMAHRGNTYGYSSWKQIRAHENPLTRKQNRHNVFTYVVEPGPSNDYKIRGKNSSNVNRHGPIRVFHEPVVSSPSKPLILQGGVQVYNERTDTYNIKTIQIETTFGNETLFFANDEINRSFGTIEETDDNYEDFKELYLNDGLEASSSPLDRFNLMVFRQTVWPKIENSFLNKTRSRLHFVSKFWRNQRYLRSASSASSFGTTIENQSIWPLDARFELATTGALSYPINHGNTFVWAYPLGGACTGSDPNVYDYLQYNYATGVRTTGQSPSYGLGFATGSYRGGSGILQNTYSQLHVGVFNNYLVSTGEIKSIPAWLVSNGFSGIRLQNVMTASCFYSRLHTLNQQSSLVSPSGMNIAEINRSVMIDTASYFCGHAVWDAPRQREALRGVESSPFYDSYLEFAKDIRIKGKDYSVIPEFRISSHVGFYQSKGVTEELPNIFELSGALSENTTTDGTGSFYKILSNSDFLRHFEMVKGDHEDFAQPAIITLKCKAIKKFLPYEGFYPAQRTVQMAEQFYQSHKDYIAVSALSSSWSTAGTASFGLQPLLEPLFAPGILFNTIKSGVACDYPVIFKNDGIQSGSSNMNSFHAGWTTNYAIYGSSLGGYSGSEYNSIFSQRVPFEALIDPARYMANRNYVNQQPHPMSLGKYNFESVWSGGGDNLYTKMANNFLAEVPSFFLKDQGFTTISSMESSNPEFGNAISGNYYAMRVNMNRSRNKPNDFYGGYYEAKVTPPQDLYKNTGVRETFTMYSRPSAFGPPTATGTTNSSSVEDFTGVSTNGRLSTIGNFGRADIYPPFTSAHGFNYPYTPPYYHGDAWCDLIWECTETRKYTVSEILSEVQQWPYYTRFNWQKGNSILKNLAVPLDFAGGTAKGIYEDYHKSPWAHLINDPANDLTWKAISQNSTTADNSILSTFMNYYPRTSQTDWGSASLNGGRWKNAGQSGGELQLAIMPTQGSSSYESYGISADQINYNAMQLNSSVNLFGKALKQSVNLSDDGSSARAEVFAASTNEAKTRWTIQTKFETPMLNFNKYTNLEENNCTKPLYASESISRGMWHQYGEIPTEPSIGVFLQIEDIPQTWLQGQLALTASFANSKVKSLADLVGFPKTKKRIGECAAVKQISEAVVAVPFLEKDNTREFFTIPRDDIDGVIANLDGPRRDRTFAAGKSVTDLVSKMRRYVFPPSMDFVKYSAIDPFAMYVFEFNQNLTTQDLADIWQNLPPTIGTQISEAEATISHALLAEELMGGGTARSAGNTIRNSPADDLPSNIRWMIFKVKKRANTDYYEKVIQNTGRMPKPAMQLASERKEDSDLRALGVDPEITYNWPYDYFSLVELVKLDAEVTFADIEEVAGKPRTIRPKRSSRITNKVMSRGAFGRAGIATARGKKKKKGGR